MDRTMDVNALARIESDTRITFTICRDGLIEFTFDQAELILEATPGGLDTLARAVNAAVRSRDEAGRQA